MKKVILWRPFLIALSAMMMSENIIAHHSRAGFDLDNETRMSGTVTDLRWANPHIFITIEREDGESWVLEGHSVPGARTLGWSRDTVQVGDEITIGGNVALDSSKTFALMSWIVTDAGDPMPAMPGRQIPADITAGSGVIAQSGGQGASSLGPPTGANPSSDMSGNWRADFRGVNLATGSIFDPDPSLPMTEAGRAVMAAYKDEDNPSYQCLPATSFEGRINAIYATRIERYDDRLEVHKENSEHFFTIWLGEENAPDNHMPNRMGLTIGDFQDERTLVYRTTGFAPSKWGVSRGLDSSEQKEIDGRMVLAEDGMTLTVSWTLTDPVYLTEPISQSATVYKDHDRELEIVPCDPEVSSMHLVQ